MTPAEAESLLAKHPEYPSVRVRLHERNEELLRRSPSTDDSLGSKERFSFLLAQLDNFAEEYIQLVSDLDSQKAFETLLKIRNQVSWVYFTGFRDTPPSSFPDEFTSLHQKTEHWITEGYRRLRRSEVATQPKPNDWEDIELSFVGDHDVEIRVAGIQTGKLNYKQISGFEDRRSGKPSQLWAMLRVFDRLPDATMPDDAKNGKEWEAIRKMIERTSKALRNHFGLTGDPLPYIDGTGYRARIRFRQPDNSR